MPKKTIKLTITIEGYEGFVWDGCLEDLIGERLSGLIDSKNLLAEKVDVEKIVMKADWEALERAVKESGLRETLEYVKEIASYTNYKSGMFGIPFIDLIALLETRQRVDVELS